MGIKDIYTGNLINSIIKEIDNSPEKSGIASVILTGSLGRDEGTFHFDENNNIILDSDIEIALVYKKGCKEQAKILKNYLIETFKEEMNPMTISLSRVKNKHNFNYSILKPKYNSIFMYDLYNGSKTIWGEDLIIDKNVKYDKYEAKRVVANRIGELTYLKYIENANNNQIVQWEAKLLLAIGTAYCIINDKYNSKYRDQYNTIHSDSSNIKIVLGGSFIDDYTQAYMYLRMGSDTYDVQSEKLHLYVENINRLFNTSEYKKPKINSVSRKLKHTISCIRKTKSLNPLNCEITIINNLIKYFINKDNKVIKYSDYWKSIIY